MKNSVKNQILNAARPYLTGKTVDDIVIGISLAACRLSDGSIGVSYILRNELPPECAAFGFAADLIGAPAEEAAELYVGGTDDVRRAIGDAVLTAAASLMPDVVDDDSSDAFGMNPAENDVVGMVGLIKPIAKQLMGKVGKLHIFDQGVFSYYGDDRVLPTELEEELLPLCNKVIITGSSTINGSIDGLLEMCANAEKVVIAGSSTPMIAEGWRNTNVTALAGTYWKPECKDEIFRAVSLGGGIAQLKAYSEKKIVKLK